MIRLKELATEAARNVISGTSKPISALVALMLVVGAIGMAQARMMVALAQDAEQWRAQGSAQVIIPAPNAIRGDQCEALARIAGISAAGAVRAAPSIRLAVLPSTQIPQFEVTPGMANLLNLQPQEFQVTGGVWLAGDLADVVGWQVMSLAYLPESIPATAVQTRSDFTVSGVYPRPDDGRSTQLAYSILSPVPAAGLFDACWVEIWPESGAVTEWLLLPVDLVAAGGSQAQIPQIGRVNSSAGLEFGAAAQLAVLPIWPLTFAAVSFSAVLGFLIIHSRRLELASALHAGIDKTSLVIQTQLEALAVTVPTLAVVFVTSYGMALAQNPDPPLVAFYPAARTAYLALIAFHFGLLLTTLMVRERHLFRHFKQR